MKSQTKTKVLNKQELLHQHNRLK